MKSIGARKATRKIQAFKQNSESWKTYLSPRASKFLKDLKTFSDEIGGNNNNCDFLILCKEICQHLGDLQDSANNTTKCTQSAREASAFGETKPTRVTDMVSDSTLY